MACGHCYYFNLFEKENYSNLTFKKISVKKTVILIKISDSK